jgi:hypothetical protein
MPKGKTKVSTSYRYSSKLTGHVLDKLIESQLIGQKKQVKTSEKFLSKMKLAIQKKISLISKDAFAATETNIKSLNAEIETTRAELTKLSDQIKAKSSAMITQSQRGLVPRITKNDINPTPDFDPKVQLLIKDIASVAKGFSTVKEDMKSRVESLSTTITQAERSRIEGSVVAENRATVRSGSSKVSAPAKALSEHLSNG